MDSHKAIRPRRDFRALERRRRRAGRLFKAGTTQAEVARRLSVTRQSASRWYAEFRRGGAGALKGAGRAGRKPRLKRTQLARIDRTLRAGAQAHGFDTDLWTLPRVARVIQRLTGVRYHPGHVWKILRGMQWTLQRPAKRARERNEPAIREWIATQWPKVKKKPAVCAPGLPFRMRAGSHSAPRSGAPGRPRGKPQS
ncbi:MAG: winged helix-turn-helix domain-containing protein [Gammaproteobacteria bacterium]